ncbi:FtsX-like permease family protein [Paenibacillus sp. CAU 1782]
MTFRSLALSNVKGNWRAYSAFFLSSVFSVLIFYIYAAFLMHPDVLSGDILAAGKVRRGMIFCLYLIIMFSILFIMYSNSAFLKTRKQEFGLFTLFGMTRPQLRKLIIYENIAISVLSISVGIGLGILFSKLFFMALAALLKLEVSIAFAIPLGAVWLTAACFFIVFTCISAWSVITMRRSEIIELLGASRGTKGELCYSPLQCAVGAIGLAGGYGMALSMTMTNFMLLALPVLLTVVSGTYFLFTQLSIILLRFIQRRKSIYYNRTNMLIFSQLGYKIKDNARILFVVSIMSAVIMTAAGTVYFMFIESKLIEEKRAPYSLAYMEKGLHSSEVMDRERLKEIIKREGFELSREVKVVGLHMDEYKISLLNGTKLLGNWSENLGYRAFIIPASTYNKLALEQGKPTIAAVSGQLTLVYPFFIETSGIDGFVEGYLNGREVNYPISGLTENVVLNFRMDSNAATLVMDDLTYVNAMIGVPEKELAVFYGYEVGNWEQSAGLEKKLTAAVPESLQKETDFTRASRYADMAESYTLTLFIGLFISLLFFIAAGSMIYFKLFTELQEDQAQIRGLTRIGMTLKEIRTTVVTQIAIVFFVPCVVGTSHALFAMSALDNIMMSSNWLYSFVVVGIFVIMQGLYFLMASRSYMKMILINDR